MSRHTSQIRYLHSQLARTVPIDAFAELITPQSIGLTDKNQFYAPIRFSVQVCGGINAAAGAVRVDVPVHANPNWLRDMKERFAGMMGIKSSAVSIEFKTVDGKSLDDFPTDFLDMAGKLHVFVNGKEMRLPKMPEIPLEYRVDKENNVDAWYAKAAEELPELVANALVGKDIDQVNAAIRGDGPIHKLISAEMIKAASPQNWSEFARTHNINSPAKIDDAEGKKVLESVSREALVHVRKFIEAAAKPIAHYIAHEQNAKIQKEAELQQHDAQYYAPVLKGLNQPAEGAGAGPNGFELYSKLVKDAFSTPTVQQAVVEKVYNMPIQGCKYYNPTTPENGGGGELEEERRQNEYAKEKKLHESKMAEIEEIETRLRQKLRLAERERDDPKTSTAAAQAEAQRKIDIIDAQLKEAEIKLAEEQKQLRALELELELEKARFNNKEWIETMISDLTKAIIAAKSEIKALTTRGANTSISLEEKEKRIDANLLQMAFKRAQRRYLKNNRNKITREDFNKALADKSPESDINRSTAQLYNELKSDYEYHKQKKNVPPPSGSGGGEKNPAADDKGKGEDETPADTKEWRGKMEKELKSEINALINQFDEKTNEISQSDNQSKRTELGTELFKLKEGINAKEAEITFLKQTEFEQWTQKQFEDNFTVQLLDNTSAIFQEIERKNADDLKEIKKLVSLPPPENGGGGQSKQSPPQTNLSAIEKKEAALLKRYNLLVNELETTISESGQDEQELSTEIQSFIDNAQKTNTYDEAIFKERLAEYADVYRRYLNALLFYERLKDDNVTKNLLTAGFNRVPLLENISKEVEQLLEKNVTSKIEEINDNLKRAVQQNISPGIRRTIFDTVRSWFWSTEETMTNIPVPTTKDNISNELMSLLKEYQETLQRRATEIYNEIKTTDIAPFDLRSKLLELFSMEIDADVAKRAINLNPRASVADIKEIITTHKKNTQRIAEKKTAKYIQKTSNQADKPNPLLIDWEGTYTEGNRFGRGLLNADEKIVKDWETLLPEDFFNYATWRGEQAFTSKVFKKAFLDNFIAKKHADENIAADINSRKLFLNKYYRTNTYKKTNAQISAHHPWNALIHHTLQPEAGVYPTYYNLLHTKQDMSTNALYKGDINATYDAHHLFSGAAPLAAPMLIGPKDRYGHEKRVRRRRQSKKSKAPEDMEARLFSIECPATRKHKSKSKSDEEHNAPAETQINARILPKLIPIEGNNIVPPRPPLKRLAKLVPIECSGNPYSDSDSDSDDGKKRKSKTEAQIKSRLPALIPLEGEIPTRPPLKRLPKLVPIECPASKEEKEEEDEKKTKAQIRSRLVPINSHHHHDDDRHHHGRHHNKKDDDYEEYKKKNVRSLMVPISAEETADDIETDISAAAAANNYGLPSIHDVFDF